MKKQFLAVFVILFVAVGFMVFAGGKQEAEKEEGITITVVADQNDLFAWFQEVSNTIFTPRTGINVVVEFVPEYRAKNT